MELNVREEKVKMVYLNSFKWNIMKIVRQYLLIIMMKI